MVRQPVEIMEICPKSMQSSEKLRPQQLPNWQNILGPHQKKLPVSTHTTPFQLPSGWSCILDSYLAILEDPVSNTSSDAINTQPTDHQRCLDLPSRSREFLLSKWWLAYCLYRPNAGWLLDWPSFGCSFDSCPNIFPNECGLWNGCCPKEFCPNN